MLSDLLLHSLHLDLAMMAMLGWSCCEMVEGWRCGGMAGLGFELGLA